MDNFNNGLIYTDVDGCIGCNNCIRECPELKANVVRDAGDGTTKIFLDDRECVLCGTCLDTCTHGVRHSKDDNDRFFADLKSGKPVSVMIAPAFLLNYPNEYKHVLGYLRSLGVKHFYSVSFGADITTWAYLNYLLKNHKQGQISQPCPAIVSYIEKHQTNLISSLIPIQSPMMTTAIYLKQYQKVPEDLAFLSPCIAKKIEIESPRGKGLIKYNVTFNGLMDRIRKEGINLRTYPELDDEIDYGLGSLFPVPGGLRENVEFYLGQEAMVVQVEGEKHAYEYFRDLPDWIKRTKPAPTLVDALNCGAGCNYGTATEFRQKHNDYVKVETHFLRKKKMAEVQDEQGMQVLDPSERFAMLNERFKDFRMEDFMCSYTNHQVNERTVSDRELENIFTDMYKPTEADRIIDCRSCGYETCKRLAVAIGLNINTKENCVYYVKAQLQNRLAQSQKIADNFEQISGLIAEMAQENIGISDDTVTINNRVEEAVNYGGEMRKTLDDVQAEFSKLTASYNEISNIARSTNILSINASIEAAHAGVHGKGFAVVATEVGDLANKSLAAANKNRDDSDSIFKVLDKLSESTETLMKHIEEIRGSTVEISDSVEGIRGKSEDVIKLMDSIQE